MNQKLLRSFIFGALLLLPLSFSLAAETKSGDPIYIAKDEIVNGNFYAAGETITVDGTISGDLIVIAQTINVNGRVEGDIIAAGQNITINGEVGGNIRIAGNSLTVNGSAIRNINAFGTNIVLGPNSRIGWDAYLAGAIVEARGIIDGSLLGRSGQALIAGKVGKNIDFRLSNNSLNAPLVISSEAIVNGDIIYSSDKAAQISDKASLAGKIQQKPIQNQTDNNRFLLWLWSKLFSVFSALAVGLIMIFIGKNITNHILSKMSEAPTKMLLPGIVLTFSLLPIALLLTITIIGLPLALIISASWLIMIYIAKILTAIVAGQLIIKKLTRRDDPSLSWPLIVGIIVCWLVFAIPYVGWLFGLAAIIFGVGGIWHYVAHQLGKI
jgi:cytoskeletal protein CcmA (bactofilin family)